MTSPTFAQTSPLDSVAGWNSTETMISWCIAWGDVDRDGDLDLAVGNLSQNNVIFFNQNGVLSQVSGWRSAEADATTCIAWGDVDGDGNLDLVVGNAEQPNRIYFNDGGLLHTVADWSSAESDSTWSIALGDVDGDGDLDLAVGNAGQPNRIYVNNAGAVETSASWSTVDYDSTLSVALADFDRDGDLDLAAGNYRRPNKIYINDSGLPTSVAGWASADSARTWCIAWGDVDGNGYPDLAAGNEGQPDAIYFTLSIVPDPLPGWRSVEKDETQTLALGDVDGDGDLDMAIGNYSQQNRIYLNRDGVLDSTADWNTVEIEGTMGLAWGDVDADGDLDLAAANWGYTHPEPIRIYLNGQGTLALDGPRSVLPLHASSATYGRHGLGIVPPIASCRASLASFIMAWGDVDADGDQDLAYSTYVSYNRDGVLDSIPIWTAADADYALSVAWGDVDGNGTLDLAAGISGQNRIYLNQGGVLNPFAQWLSSDRSPTNAIAWGDVDGDGDLDLAAGNSFAPNCLYLNHSGVLNPDADWKSSDSNPTRCIAWGDVDNDGDLDLAAGSIARPCAIYYNHNGMLDSTPGWSSFTAEDVRCLAWGDWDGDGDLDLAIGGRTANKIFFNEGGRLDGEAGWSSEEREDTYSITWTDVDGDGDLDLATGNLGVWGSPVRIYLNRSGALSTSSDWSFTDSLINAYIAWSDADGDGDLDLAGLGLSISPVDAPPRVYANRREKAPAHDVNLPNSPALVRDLRLLAHDTTDGKHECGLTLADMQSDLVDIAADYSPLGGGQWFPATILENTKRLPTLPEGIPYQFTWDTGADGVDGYDVWLRLRAFSNPDHAGLIQWPAQPYLLHVGRIDNRPKISVLYPNAGSVVAGSMSLLGRIWDATNFSQFQIQMAALPDTASWTLLYASASPVPRPADIADLDLAAADPGAHLLRIAATDVSGHTTVRDLRIEIGLPAERAPVVQRAYPPRGAANVPGNAPVVLQFDQPLHQPSIKSETFVVRSEQGDVYTNSLYDFKTRTLTLVPNRHFTAQKFHYLVTTHDLQSSTGFAMGGDYVSAFHTTPSTLSADIDSLVPRRGADEVPIASDTLFVYCNRPSAFTHIAVFDLTGQTVASGPVFDAGTGAGRIAYPGLTPATYYLVRISDRPTFDGPSDYMSYFITEDTQLPVLTSFTPADQSWLVSLDQPIRLVFNKPLNTRTVDSSSFYLQGPSGRVGGFIQFGAGSDSVLTFAPDEPYEPLTTYSVVVTSHVQDNLGNPIDPATWTFTTGSFHTVGFSGDYKAAGAFEIFFPQGALPADTRVGLGPVPANALLIDPALTFSGMAVDIRPGLLLSRGAVLTAAVPDSLALRHGGANRLKFFAFDSALAEWNYLGGSAEGNRVSVTVERLGRYGLFESSPQAASVDFASTVALIPRVINPRRGTPGGTDQLNVSYKIAQPAKVTAKIYSTRGELIKTLASDYLSSVGENLLQWDGRADDGNYARDGIYVLVIEADGQQVQKTFVIVNR